MFGNENTSHIYCHQFNCQDPINCLPLTSPFPPTACTTEECGRHTRSAPTRKGREMIL